MNPEGGSALTWGRKLRALNSEETFTFGGLFGGLKHECYAFLCHLVEIERSNSEEASRLLKSGVLLSDDTLGEGNAKPYCNLKGTERNEYIVPLENGVILISHRAASPLVRLEEGEEMWNVLDPPTKFNRKIGMEPNRILLSPAWCSKLRLTIDVQISSCHD
ncbi:hypothetical protein TNCV_3969301 [Trichonephila clavipes]|nr:hypothetical protein TNCV_3969301 [Trichonephila clavipes]